MRSVYLYVLTCVSVVRVGGKYGYITAARSGQKYGMEVSEAEYSYDIPETHVARAVFTDQITENGWAFLEITSSAAYPDELQARAAGFLEGYLSRDLIWMHWVNVLKGFCTDKMKNTCKLVERFVDENELYVKKMAKSHVNDPYWYQVLLIYRQLEGVAIGYNDANHDPAQRLTFRDIFWLNMIGDLDELAFSLSLRSNHSTRSAGSLERELVERLAAADHCTGLVKLIPDLSNLYTSQTTWNSYQSMLRLQKLYVLNFNESESIPSRIPGYKMSLSSYPGIVQILEFVRTMVANRLARSGREWVEIFRRHNSGTYNNQWYIVDYNKFEAATSTSPGRVRPGLLWVVEQLPGAIESADLTGQLLETTYFPSYNMPHFPRMFELSGGRERVRTYGDWFGQRTNPRAKMLKLLQANIHNMKDMLYTMRYNDFKHDPLARCAQCRPPYSACNAVAARNDLNPANGTYPFRALGHRSHGATDAKVTSARLRSAFRFVAVAGPPHNRSRGIPPFKWSEFDLGANISHLGHPDTWVFPPVRHDWEWGYA